MKPGPRSASAPLATPDVDEACRRLRIHLSAPQVAQLGAYVALLTRWNATYNLTAIRDPAKIWTHHILDCLSVVGPLRRHRAGHVVTRLLDVGSGAGLPGILLAIAEPDLTVVCLDAVGKKVAFIRQVAAELGLTHVSALHHRVETLEGQAFEVIGARAYASLLELVSGTRHLLAEGGTWMAMKGKEPAAELAAVAPLVSFHVEQLSVPSLDEERCLVWMKPL